MLLEDARPLVLEHADVVLLAFVVTIGDGPAFVGVVLRGDEEAIRTKHSAVLVEVLRGCTDARMVVGKYM